MFALGIKPFSVKGDGKGGGAFAGEMRSLGGERAESGALSPPAGRAEGYRLLRCAEQGDVRGLEDILRRGCDINFRDQFKWTALMSASYSGRTRAVRSLLHQGALWTHITDTQVREGSFYFLRSLSLSVPLSISLTHPLSLKGRNARDLARLAGHHDIVTILEHDGITRNSHISHRAADSKLR